MIYTDYCDLRAITSSIVNTNIVNKSLTHINNTYCNIKFYYMKIVLKGCF